MLPLLQFRAALGHILKIGAEQIGTNITMPLSISSSARRLYHDRSERMGRESLSDRFLEYRLMW